MRHHGIAIVLTAMLVDCGVARAEDWPARPVTLVIPYAAGGPTDVIGRLFAQQMSERLGRQIIVENVAGAGGMTGANRVVNAAPDGYQVLFGGSGNLVFNQVLYKKPLFSSLNDLAPVALLTEQSLVLIARKDLITALEQGRTRLGLRLKLTHAQHDALVQDASGDRLDAVLCLVQAAWAARHGAPAYGLPADLDPLEGWIVSA